MEKNIKEIMNRKKTIASILSLVFIGLFIVVPDAQAADWPTKVLGGLLGALIGAVGLMLILVIKALIYVASYSNFINSGAVTYGWIMVRDLANMFFVVILLIIAFGTILNIPNYNYKQWLPKLILGAILINFSKTICGLLIDVAQVIMLTFVNSFKDIGGANMTTVLGIDTILQLDKDSPDAEFWTIVGAYLLGLIYIIIALIVITTMMIMLVMRIVMIWIYVVLSPLAYLLAAFPGGKSYASQWWSEFTKNLIVGPVLAFFIWLSLAALNADQISAEEKKALEESMAAESSSALDNAGSNDTAVMMTESSSPAALIKFVIAIGMLLGGLKISQSVGGAAGSIAGKGMNAVNKAKNIGIAGVAGATGYTYAKGVAQNYNSMRQAKKQEKMKRGAENLALKVGETKKKVGTAVSSGLNRTKSAIGLNNAGNKAQALNLEAQRKRTEIAQMQNNLKRKDGQIRLSNQQGQDEDWVYDKDGKDWVNKTTQQRKSQDEISKQVSDRSQTLRQEADVASANANVQMKKQQRTDKWVKAGLITAGVGVGLLTGGAGFSAPLAGAAMLGGGVAGGYKGKKKLSTMGNTDLAYGSNARDREVEERMKNMEDDEDSDVLLKMDDASADKFTRTAAALEAMSRGLLSSQEAQNRKEIIKRDIGTDANGNISDKKIAKRFETIAEKNNVSATKRFEDLRSNDPEKRQKAENAIVRDIEVGKIKLDSLDAGAVEQIGGSLSKSMKTKNFVAQMKEMSDPEKKDQILSTLQTQALDEPPAPAANATDSELAEYNNVMAEKMEIKKKLARVNGLEYAVPTPPAGASQADMDKAQKERETILADLTFEELVEIFNGNDDKQQNAITDVMNQSGRAQNVFSGVASNHLMGPSVAARDLRIKLNIPHPQLNGSNQNNQNSQNTSNSGSGNSSSGSGSNSGGSSNSGSSANTGNQNNQNRPAPGPAPAGYTWNGSMFVPNVVGGRSASGGRNIT